MAWASARTVLPVSLVPIFFPMRIMDNDAGDGIMRKNCCTGYMFRIIVAATRVHVGNEDTMSDFGEKIDDLKNRIVEHHDEHLENRDEKRIGRENDKVNALHDKIADAKNKATDAKHDFEKHHDEHKEHREEAHVERVEKRIEKHTDKLDELKNELGDHAREAVDTIKNKATDTLNNITGNDKPAAPADPSASEAEEK